MQESNAPRRTRCLASRTGPLLLLGLLALDARAERGEADPFFGEIPMVLTASRLAQSPLDAPAPVTVIDREMIVASGFNEIHDLLRLAPGFLVADHPDGPPAVASHGLGDANARRIKVMVDGRTINSPLWGNVIWDNLPLRVDDVERIEVVRGPNGAAYGVNAFQGVVNIITRAPSTESGRSVVVRAGRNRFYEVGVRLNGEGGGPFDWRLHASRRELTPFEPHYRVVNQEGEWGSAESTTRNAINFNSVLQISALDELSFVIGVSEGASKRGAKGDDDYPPHAEDDRALHLQAGWRRQVDAESVLSLQYFHQGERAAGSWMVSQTYDKRTASFPTSRASEARRHDLELQYDTRLGRRLTGMLGIGVRSEHARSTHLFGTGQWLDSTHGQVFGSVTWNPLAPLKIDLGGTLEHHDYSGRLFSPRIAINYAPDADSALRLSTGTAYRAPSLMESRAFQTDREGDTIRRIGFRVFDPLQSERMRFVDLGYVAQLRPLGVHFDARVFREHYRRFIDDKACVFGECPGVEPADYVPIDPDKKSFYFLNANDFRMTGAEFTVDWRKPGWGRAILSQAFIEIDRGEPYSDKDIPRSAPHSTTALLLIKDFPGRWQASLGYYHNGLYYWMNGGDIVPRTDRFDLRIARRFGPPGSDNEVSLTALSLKGRYADFHADKFRREPDLYLGVRIGW
ncbi:TonB-dependent receptor plug domain-containing protein [Thauera phenylacetica]